MGRKLLTFNRITILLIAAAFCISNCSCTSSNGLVVEYVNETKNEQYCYTNLYQKLLHGLLFIH